MSKRCFAFVVILATCPLAHGHYIWLVTSQGPDGATRVEVIFGERAKSDDPSLLERIDGVQVERLTAKGVTPLEIQRSDSSWFAHLDDSKGPIVTRFDYGLLERNGERFLLRYYAKAGASIDDVSTPATAASLDLDIVPRLRSDGTIAVTVLFKGHPLEGASVAQKREGLDDVEGDTNAAGEVSLAEGTVGLVSLHARHIEKVAGEWRGTPYVDVRHHATLTFGVANSGMVSADRTWPEMPLAVSSFGATICAGSLYVYGGHVGRRHSYSTESTSSKLSRLDLRRGQSGWEDLASGPSVQGVALVSHGDQIFRLGGMRPRNAPGEVVDTVSLASCERFDTKTSKWNDLIELPAPRSSHDAIVISDRIYVIGGWSMAGRDAPSQWHDTALVMDLTQEPLEWKEFSQPFRRRAHQVGSLEGRLYVVGGLDMQGDVVRRVDIFDPTSGNWTVGPELPGPQFNGFSPAVCSVGQDLFVSPSDGGLYRLSKDRSSWVFVGELSLPRFVHRLVSCDDDTLLVIGGALRSGENVASLEEISLASMLAERSE